MAIMPAHTAQPAQPTMPLRTAFHRVTVTPQVEDSLRRLTGFDRQTLAAIATGDLPDLQSVSIDFKAEEEHGLYEIAYSGAGYYDSYTLDFPNRIVAPGNLKNGRNDRLTGRRMFANRVLMGTVLGFERLTLNAGNMMGGYSWARAGIYPHQICTARLAACLGERAAIILDQVLPEDRTTLLDLARLRHPTHLWDIANWSQDVRVDDAAFAGAMASGTQNYSLWEYRQDGFCTTEMSVGQFMLMGQNYAAYIRFENACQMDALEDYACKPVRDIAAAFKTGHTAAALNHALRLGR